MAKTVYYVEMSKIVYYNGEFEADTPEEAQNEILLMAGGDPRDWTILTTQEVKRFEIEPGSMSAPEPQRRMDSDDFAAHCEGYE